MTFHSNHASLSATFSNFKADNKCAFKIFHLGQNLEHSRRYLKQLGQNLEHYGQNLEYFVRYLNNFGRNLEFFL